MLLVSKLARVHLNLGTGYRLVSALGDSQLASAISVAMCDRFTPSTNICLSGALTNACKPGELWVLSHRQFTLSSFSSAFLPPFLSPNPSSLWPKMRAQGVLTVSLAPVIVPPVRAGAYGDPTCPVWDGVARPRLARRDRAALGSGGTFRSHLPLCPLSSSPSASSSHPGSNLMRIFR